MELFEYICRHPLNSLVSERGGQQNGGFIARGKAQTLHRNGRDYSLVDKVCPLEGITEPLQRIFWPNYRATRPIQFDQKRRKEKKGKEAPIKWRRQTPYDRGLPLRKKSRQLAAGAATTRMSGRERGSKIHQEIQIASKVVSVRTNSNESTSAVPMQTKVAELDNALAITSTVLSNNGNQRRPTKYTEAILQSMLTIWNWRPLDAEFTVGDVLADPLSRLLKRVGKYATRIDFVGLNEKTGNLILGELKSGYNSGVFHSATGTMRAGLNLDNSPFNQAKVQLVMGACMLVRQFQLSPEILLLQHVELFVIHCPTRAGELVRADLISPDEIRQIQQALYITGTLLSD